MSDNANAACPAVLTNSCAQRHWAIYWILIVCSVAMVGGRVVTVKNHSAQGDSPFFCANDRSRWCTIRALGDQGVYEIDDIIADPENKIAWDSIDKVRHAGRDGEFHYYSSKPTLLPTLLAWQYKAIKYCTGWTLRDNTTAVVRAMLVVNSVFPWLIFLWLFGLIIDRIPVRDWTRYYVLAAASFGTFLSTFAIALNNHVPAAISAMIVLFGLCQICRVDTVLDENGQYVSKKFVAGWAIYFLTGLFAAFAASNELPALLLMSLAGLACLMKSPVNTFLGFVPGASIIAVASFATNYAAHGDWRPPYAHRSDGPVLETVNGQFAAQLNNRQLPPEIREALPNEWEMIHPQVELGCWPEIPAGTLRWVVRDRISTNQFSITNESGKSEFLIHEWNNWYDYPGSYWLTANENKSLVDQGQPSKILYAFHVLFGHHGVFSLTPIWLFAFAGMFGLTFDARLKLSWLGWMSLILTIVVLVFYIIFRPAIDRNYGGVTSGLRWLFWLAPFWLISMMPVVDWLGRSRSGRFVCFALLGASALSALYSADNPWVAPWLYEIWNWTGLPI